MRLLVFDLDGTLIDSRKDLATSVNLMLAEYGARPLPAVDVTRMVGEGARVLVERALTAAGLPWDDTPRALNRFLEIYGDHLLDETRPYHGIPELLRGLHARAQLAVLTNKPTAATVRILEKLGLGQYFVEVLGGDSPYPRKPDPSALLHLVDACHASPENTMMVGDSPIDLQTARNARVRCCLVRYGFGFAFSARDLAGVFVADTPADIVTAVQAWRAPQR